MATNKKGKLRKELGLFDVYVISTGAMISSGFFLLPGLAAAKTGPSVVIAYAIAGILILPAMFSIAELATAMPKAGGAYYFLDRALGPMAGTIGGLGTYLALSLKTAFALIGIGAYLTIYVDLPIKPVAISLTLAFMALNIFGAKETTGLQRILVIVLIAILTFFMAEGLWEIFATDNHQVDLEERFTPFFTFGIEGLLSTIGFVFVSYAGLTKVASVAEEVKNPDRNIPLGMILSLSTTTVIYVVGIFIIVTLIPPASLHTDLTPVASASKLFMNWPSEGLGLILIVVAATAAFASTGNAGILASSRYPFAMAKDRLVPSFLSSLGRFSTPVPAIMITSGLIIFFIVALDEEGIAKLASAFQLFIFVLVNLSVIVMRQSKITAYDPGFESPLYPWMQIFGMVVSLTLIVAMGWVASLFTLGVILFCLAWFHYYARDHVVRDGAIYHWFARLGGRIYTDLDIELRAIMKEKGLRKGDHFEEIVANAAVIDLDDDKEYNFPELIDLLSDKMIEQYPDKVEELAVRLTEVKKIGPMPISKGVALPHIHLPGIEHPFLIIVRSQAGIHADEEFEEHEFSDTPIHALFMLISEEENARQHLRLLAQIAVSVDNEGFVTDWLVSKNEQSLKEILLRDERYLSLQLNSQTATNVFIGKALKEIELPDSALVVLIRREGEIMIPHGNTIFEESDRITIIGDPKDVKILYEKYVNR